MKKFLIIAQQPVTQIWEYEVEAETEEEALAMVENGEIDPYDYVIEDNAFSSPEYTVEVLHED